MSSSKSPPSSITEQRKRFEALGNAVNKASSIRGWIKTVFYVTLVFGIPSLFFLSDALKDGVSLTYQVIIFGFRILIIAMSLLLISRITPEMFTAKNDLDKKLEEIGYKDSKTNTPEEKKIMRNNIILSFLKIITLVGSIAGIFLVSSRDNYGYILAHQIIFLVIIFCLVITFKFWSSNNPKESPRLGGRVLVYAFLPSLIMWGFEVIMDFFSVLNEAIFHYNILQISWGIIYPFIFIFLLIAVIITTRKTKREKMQMQEARQVEFQRKETSIQEKSRISRFRYKSQISWNKFTQKYQRFDRKEQDLDKKPNIILVKSIWIALFISFIPFSFLLPWNLFPQDGILIVIALMVSYQYSMVKYDREKIDVIAEPDRQEGLEPSEIRTKVLTITTFRLILIPTILFIIAQYFLSAIVAKGDYSTYNNMLTMSFTWVSVLIVIPISVQLIIYLNENTVKNREDQNIGMYRQNILILLLIELVLLTGSVVARYVGQTLDYTLLPSFAIILQMIFVVTIILIPLIYLYIIPNLDDKKFQIARISTYTLLVIVNLGILTLFLLNVLSFFGIVSFPFQ